MAVIFTKITVFVILHNFFRILAEILYFGALRRSRRILSVFIGVKQALRIGNMLLNMFFYLAGRKMSVNFTPKIKNRF